MTYELDEIKKIRKNLGITQFDLAKRSNVSQSLIAKIEAGRIDPTYSKAKQIFTALKDLGKKQEKKADEIMTEKIVSVKPDEDIKTAIKKMKQHNISQLPVIEEHKSIGLVSESILLEAFIDNKGKKIKDVMQDSPPVIPKNASIEVISNLLRFSPLVLVSESGKLIGLITKSDLLGAMYKS